MRSAGHDEEQFADAAMFDPERSPNRHLAFGAGIHRCPGAPLGKAEIRTMIAHVLKRMPDFTIDDSKVTELNTGLTKGGRYTSLPTTFSPGQRAHRPAQPGVRPRASGGLSDAPLSCGRSAMRSFGVIRRSHAAADSVSEVALWARRASLGSCLLWSSA